MCQHNKARVMASSRHDKVEDIECLAPDPSVGGRPSREERENGSKEMETRDGKKYRGGKAMMRRE